MNSSLVEHEPHYGDQVVGVGAQEGGLSPAGMNTVQNEDDDASACRICMEPVTPQQMLTGDAFRLGCRCHNGRDAVHGSCGAAWFESVRRDSHCEVCREECTGLPSDMIARIRLYKQLTRWAVGFVHPIPTRPPRRLLRLALEALLPTVVVLGCALLYFRVRISNAETLVGLLLILGAYTMLHWTIHAGRRPLLHLLFCTLLVPTIVATREVLVILFRADDQQVSETWLALDGVGMGAALALLLLYLFILPAAILIHHLIARWAVQPHWPQGMGSQGGPEQESNRLAPAASGPTVELQAGAAQVLDVQDRQQAV